MPALTEAELVQAIASGSDEAASAFVGHFQGRVARILLRHGIPVDDQNDVTQEIMADALRQIRDGRFRSESTLTTWLYTIVKGKAADYRRKKRPPTVPLETVNADDPALATTSLSNDDVLAVQQALSRLPTEEQVLLLLHDSERYTLEEIGPMIGLRKSAVAQRLERAREHFRAAIGGSGNRTAPKRLTE